MSPVPLWKYVREGAHRDASLSSPTATGRPDGRGTSSRTGRRPRVPRAVTDIDAAAAASCTAGTRSTSCARERDKLAFVTSLYRLGRLEIDLQGVLYESR